jgi:cytochrome c-type biogenesis protein CcmH
VLRLCARQFLKGLYFSRFSVFPAKAGIHFEDLPHNNFMLLFYFLIAILLSIFLACLIIPVIMHSGKTLFKNPRADSWIFGVAVILVPVAAILLYREWGASHQLAESYAMSRAVTEMSAQSGNINQVDQVIRQFLNYLTSHPHDAKGWYLLGRLYFDQGNVVKAATAFKNSFENDPQNSEVMAEYAQALYLLHHQQLTNESLQLVQKVLSEDSKNVTVLNLLAMDAFLHHRYALAMTYWKRLRTQYPEGSAEFKTLTHAIEICKKK